MIINETVSTQLVGIILFLARSFKSFVSFLSGRTRRVEVPQVNTLVHVYEYSGKLANNARSPQNQFLVLDSSIEYEISIIFSGQLSGH